MNEMNNIILNIKGNVQAKAPKSANKAAKPDIKEKFEAILKQKANLGEEINESDLNRELSKLADKIIKDEKIKKSKVPDDITQLMKEILTGINMPVEISEDFKNLLNISNVSNEIVSLEGENLIEALTGSEIHKTVSDNMDLLNQAKAYETMEEQKNVVEFINSKETTVENKAENSVSVQNTYAENVREKPLSEDLNLSKDSSLEKIVSANENLVKEEIKISDKKVNFVESIKAKAKEEPQLKPIENTAVEEKSKTSTLKNESFKLTKDLNKEKSEEKEKIIVKNEFSTDFIVSTEQKLKAIELPKEEALTAMESQMVKNADITEQILKNVSLKMPKGANVFEMQLNPEFLGRVTVKMQIENGRAILEFAAQTHKGEIALRENLTQLQTALKEQNIEVDRMNVTYDSTGNTASRFNQNSGEFVFQQNRNHNQNQHNQGGQRANMVLRETDDESISVVDEDFIRLQQMSMMNYRV